MQESFKKHLQTLLECRGYAGLGKGGRVHHGYDSSVHRSFGVLKADKNCKVLNI